VYFVRSIAFPATEYNLVLLGYQLGQVVEQWKNQCFEDHLCPCLQGAVSPRELHYTVYFSTTPCFCLCRGSVGKAVHVFNLGTRLKLVFHTLALCVPEEGLAVIITTDAIKYFPSVIVIPVQYSSFYQLFHCVSFFLPGFGNSQYYVTI